jgi:hypothetical protein
LRANVLIGSIGEWVRVRDRLASVPTIRKVDLLSLNRHEAKIQIKYVGGSDQLKSSLAAVDLVSTARSDLAAPAPGRRALVR